MKFITNPALGAVNGDADSTKPVKKRKLLEPEYPMRVSDRGNKGMASSTFLADWLSTHFEPKDETEGEVVSKVWYSFLVLLLLLLLLFLCVRPR